MRRLLPTLLLALCLYQSAPVRATEVILFSSLQDEHHSRYRQELEAAIAPAGMGERRLSTARSQEREPATAPLPDDTALVIATGARACEQALTLPQPPVLCVFISEATYQRLIPGARAPQHTALYLEQPLDRRFNLARLLLPPQRELTVLLPGFAAAADTARLETAAEAAAVPLSVLRLDAGRNPASLIQQAMDRHQVLLALPDPAVYNRHTIHGILLTTYRKGIAVIGFSESFVNAGAIAAVHSTPEDLAGATAAMAEAFLADTAAGLPPPGPSPRFSISLNRRVARTLNIDLPPEARLHHQLLDMESGTR